MKRLAWIAAALLIALGSAGVLAQTTTPTVSPQIPLQEIKVNGRTYHVSPYELTECYIIRRTLELPASSDPGLDKTISYQCFVREGDEMVPIEEREARDFGITEQAAVGQAIISEPQVLDPEDGQDG